MLVKLMVVIVCSWSAASSAGASFPIGQEPPPPPCKLPKLREELAARVATDQQARGALIEAMQKRKAADAPLPADVLRELTRVDSENTAWLKQQIETHGWLGKTLVGEDGAHHAWLLVQHADRDPAFQEACLQRMREAAEGEVSRKDIAYLTDRVLVAQGKPQRFGTQCELQDGKAVVKDVEDRDNLDARRKSMGLVPLEEYLREVERAYSGGGS